MRVVSFNSKEKRNIIARRITQEAEFKSAWLSLAWRENDIPVRFVNNAAGGEPWRVDDK